MTDVYRMRPISEATNPREGTPTWSPVKSLWFTAMASIALVGGWQTFSWDAALISGLLTAITLCLGHSIGFHRLLIHRSFECPRMLEYFLVYLGVLVGMGGPKRMVYMHDIRDWAQRQPRCHAFFYTPGARVGRLVSADALPTQPSQPSRVSPGRADHRTTFLSNTRPNLDAATTAAGARPLFHWRDSLGCLRNLCSSNHISYWALAYRLHRTPCGSAILDRRWCCCPRTQSSRTGNDHHGRILAQQPSCFSQFSSTGVSPRTNRSRLVGTVLPTPLGSNTQRPVARKSADPSIATPSHPGSLPTTTPCIKRATESTVRTYQQGDGLIICLANVRRIHLELFSRNDSNLAVGSILLGIDMVVTYQFQNRQEDTDE